MPKFPPITNPARPFRLVALRAVRGRNEYDSAIIGPDDQIETRSWMNHTAPLMFDKAKKLNDLYERGFLAGQLTKEPV